MGVSADYFSYTEKGRARLIATSWKHINYFKSSGVSCHQYIDLVAVRLTFSAVLTLEAKCSERKSGHDLSSAEHQ